MKHILYYIEIIKELNDTNFIILLKKIYFIYCLYYTYEINILQILHIDGACARCPKDAEYNRGNVRFELQLFANTEVTILGEHDDVNDLEEVLEMDLCDIIHHENKIISMYIIYYINI